MNLKAKMSSKSGNLFCPWDRVMQQLMYIHTSDKIYGAAFIAIAISSAGVYRKMVKATEFSLSE